MKIFSAKKNKSKEVKSVDILLTIEELDGLINFLSEAKTEFVERQNQPSLTKIEGDGFKEMTSYSDVVEMGNEIINYHCHYQDYNTSSKNNGIDVVVHTLFKAIKKDDGTFEWQNVEDDN